MFSLVLLLILFFLLSVKSFVVSRCIILGVCTVVEDSSSGRLSNKYWAVWVETLRPVMSKINHHTASTGWGSAEINQAEKAHRERSSVCGHTGVNPPTATWVRTLQEISQNESLTLCCILWVFLLLRSLSSFSFFSLSHCFFICLCPPLPQIKPTNLSLTSLAPMPGPPPLPSSFFLPSPLPWLFHDVFISSCWVMSARIVTFFVLPESSNNSMTNIGKKIFSRSELWTWLKWLSCDITSAIYPNSSPARTNRPVYMQTPYSRHLIRLCNKEEGRRRGGDGNVCVCVCVCVWVCVTVYEFAISVFTSISPPYDSDRKQAIYIIMSEVMD